MNRAILWVALPLLFLAAAPLQAQQDARVPDPDPELERRALQVADGFEVNLFAADPLLAKPLAMNFDPAGRLWVACSEVYPQIKPGQEANDKIVVLEDTKGAGRADKVTVFADGLLIPTGVAPGDGGVYVAASTELLHFADTDGDGKADRRRVVLAGFGTEDTHHMLHALRWGPDGMLYMNQSIYIHSHIETPHGPRHLLGGGVWQFRPETMQLEVFARGFWNPWGHDFDRWGQSFVTDGAGTEGINYIVPGAGYATAVGVPRILEGLNPGSPKYCQHEIVSGRHLPDSWQGNIITNDFRAHRVCRFVLQEDGSGYTAREQGELIRTNHDGFRPVDVKMGPDGAIYIADWYNPIIQHGEVDFRDPRRDHVHGRIWRVTAKGRPLVPRPKLFKASTEVLLDDLKAPEGWTRQQAKRVLKERGGKVVPALAAWVKHLDPADPDHEHQLLEALWTYQALDVPEPDLLATLLPAKDHHARAAAVRVAGAWQDRLPNPMELLAPRVADDHPQVRMEAVRALARVPSARSVEIALHALDRPVDRFLDYALWLTVRELEPVWMPAFQKGQLDFGGDLRRLTFALQAAASPGAIKPLVDLVKPGKVSADREEGVLALIAGLGGPEELGMVFDRVLAGDPMPASERVHLLEALGQAAQQRRVRPAGDLARVGKLLTADSDALRAAAIRDGGLWQVQALRPQLVEYAEGKGTPAVVRQAAFDALALLGDRTSRDALDQLAASNQPPEVRRLAVGALAAVDPGAAARRAVDLLAMEGAPDPADVFNAFLRQKTGPDALATALQERKLPADVAKIGVRTVRSSGRDAPALVTALTKAGGLTGGPRQLTDAEMRQMVADVRQLGDPARGEAIFRRKELSCLKCHAIAGAGGQVGPDLSSIGASAQVDYLIDSILVPNKAVKENYHALIVGTTKGQVFTGVKVRETNTELVLRDAEDREISIPVKMIDERTMGGSLMPEGAADSLTRPELVNLVRFLSELGKVGPYAVGKAQVVRRWQALADTPPARQELQRGSPGTVPGDQLAFTWAPEYSTVAGTLPLDALPHLTIDRSAACFVRCQLHASTAGKVKLLLNSAAYLTVWLDQTPLEVKESMVFDVPAGIHALTFGLDLGKRNEGLRCELDDVPGSPARVRIVGGK
jgi:putative heme-binding domain-containing protein